MAGVFHIATRLGGGPIPPVTGFLGAYDSLGHSYGTPWHVVCEGLFEKPFRRCRIPSTATGALPMAVTRTKSSAFPGHPESATTLVEVLVAMVVLMVMALGSAAYMYHSRAGIIVQGIKRLALEAGTTRLEEIRTSAYDDVRPELGNLCYLSKVDGHLLRHLADPEETVAIGGRALPMTTEIQLVREGTVPHEYLHVAVTVGYGADPSATVTLETVYSP